jgi:biopolymer transport protein ExbB
MQNPYGLAALIKHGDAVSIAVLGVLLLMSLATWCIIFTKLRNQRRLIKSVKNVEKKFWSAGSPREGADKLPINDDLRLIAESAMHAAQHHEAKMGGRISLRDWLAMVMQRPVDGLTSKLSNGLTFLATIGLTAPLVGLFGTLYNILKTLIAMGMAGQPTFEKAAGPVGQALLMTVLGLAVAVPAIFGYNILRKRNKAIQDSMRDFTGDLEANLVGGLRPDFSRGASASLVTRK